jgi:hypothetical protein
MNRRNYYRVLHVQPDAPVEVIRAAYRALMVRHHPDRGGDHEKAALLNEAWSVLGDLARRSAYDAKRADRTTARSRTDDGLRARGTRRPQPEPAHAPAGACPFCTAPHGPADTTCARCQAPLARVKVNGQAKRWSDDERRRLPRVSRADWATLRPDWRTEPIDVRMRNLSLEGVSFFCGAPLAAPSRVRITGAALDAVVDVLRCTRSGNIYVVQGQFVTVQFAAKAGGFVYTTA